MIDLSNYSIFGIYLYFFKNANSYNLNLYKGVFYITLHMLYGVLLLLTLFFITNINYLFMVFLITNINCFVIYKFRRCPLAELEIYHLNFSCIDYIFKNINKFLNFNTQEIEIKHNKKKKPNHKKNNKNNNKKNICFKHLKVNNIDEVSLENLVICASCIVCKIFILMLYNCIFNK